MTHQKSIERIADEMAREILADPIFRAQMQERIRTMTTPTTPALSGLALAAFHAAAFDSGFDLTMRPDGGYRSVEPYTRPIADALRAALEAAGLETGWSVDDDDRSRGWVTVYPELPARVTRYTLDVRIDCGACKADGSPYYSGAEIERRVRQALSKLDGDVRVLLMHEETVQP